MHEYTLAKQIQGEASYCMILLIWYCTSMHCIEKKHNHLSIYSYSGCLGPPIWLRFRSCCLCTDTCFLYLLVRPSQFPPCGSVGRVPAKPISPSLNSSRSSKRRLVRKRFQPSGTGGIVHRRSCSKQNRKRYASFMIRHVQYSNNELGKVCLFSWTTKAFCFKLKNHESVNHGHSRWCWIPNWR